MRCRRGNKTILAFSLGLLVSSVLPTCWVAVVVTVLLVITSFVASPCRKF